jgi:hypothetical protein
MTTELAAGSRPLSPSSTSPVAGSPQPGLAAWPATNGSWAWVALCLVLVSAVAAFLHWTAIAAAAATWTHSPTYGYGMLVPPVVAFLLWRQRAALRQIAPRPWPWGLVLVGGAALVASIGRAVSTLVIE